MLAEAGKAAFQKYLNSGGNFVGVHCASACFYDGNDEWFQKEIGR